MAGTGVADELARLSLGQGWEPEVIRPPNLKSKGIVPVDITKKFSEAVDTLSPGELVKDGFFTLFESVTSLEIMDPKMDSGCLNPDDEFEELYDVSKPLMAEEVLSIMDQLLCHEMAWHLGYPLLQTLFTSVYVESMLMPNPQSITEANFVRTYSSTSPQPDMLKALRAYCLGTLKACAYVNERIMSEHYYEEEDFVTNTYNRTLLANVSTDAIRDVIAQARETLSSVQESISADLRAALSRRLELREALLDVAECANHMSNPEAAKEPWRRGLEIIKGIQSTHSLGKPVEDSFSAKLQKKLASTMPPRPIVQLSFEDAFGHLTRLLQDGLEMVHVLHYTDSQCLQTFVSTLQTKKPQPLIYIRTLLQTFLFNAMQILGTMSIRSLLDNDMALITLPASPLLDRANDDVEAPQDPRFEIAKNMELFRQHAAQPFLDVLRSLCQNRCRVRRTLCHVVREWETLQVDAEDTDQLLENQVSEMAKPRGTATSSASPELHALPLSSWTYLYKLRQMEMIVQLGFELEVYQVDEFAGMYWHLNYLAKCRVQHSERIKTFVIQRAEEIRANPGRQKAGAGEEIQRSLSFARLSLLDAAVTWELSDALSCLYTVLKRLNLIKTPRRPYGNDELRYELRMKPFDGIGIPALPSFEVFTESTMQPDTPTLEILEYAEKALAGAKKGFDMLSKMSAEESFSVGSHERWLGSVKSALKSCIATGIAIAAVHKSLSRAGEDGELKLRVEVPTPNKAYHEWWIVPRVVPC